MRTALFGNKHLKLCAGCIYSEPPGHNCPARQWLENEYLLLYREFPGFNAMIGEPIKSGGWGTPNNNAKEKGDFVLIYFFDSKQTKDHYFPESGGWSEDIINGIKKHQQTFDKLFGKYFIQDKYQMEE